MKDLTSHSRMVEELTAKIEQTGSMELEVKSDVELIVQEILLDGLVLHKNLLFQIRFAHHPVEIFIESTMEQRIVIPVQ